MRTQILYKFNFSCNNKEGFFPLKAKEKEGRHEKSEEKRDSMFSDFSASILLYNILQQNLYFHPHPHAYSHQIGAHRTTVK